jgi:hypothetical protein
LDVLSHRFSRLSREGRHATTTGHGQVRSLVRTGSSRIAHGSRGFAEMLGDAAPRCVVDFCMCGINKTVLSMKRCETGFTCVERNELPVGIGRVRCVLLLRQLRIQTERL